MTIPYLSCSPNESCVNIPYPFKHEADSAIVVLGGDTELQPLTSCRNVGGGEAHDVAPMAIVKSCVVAAEA